MAILLLAFGGALAQEPKPGAADEKPPRGPLPPFYKAVIDGLQRDQIYAIQDKYDGQINELEAKITALRAARDKEVDAVLRPEQRDKVAQLVKEADAKKPPKAEKKKKAASDDEAAKPAEAKSTAKKPAT